MAGSLFAKFGLLWIEACTQGGNRLMGAEIRTFRTRRTWFEKLLLWPRAYESKIFDCNRKVIGRGHTPKAAQEAAERQWVAKAQREYEANRPSGNV